MIHFHLNFPDDKSELLAPTKFWIVATGTQFNGLTHRHIFLYSMNHWNTGE